MARTVYAGILLAILIPTVIGAQAIDSPAATVKLYSLEVIGLRQLRTQIELLESRTGQQVPKEQRRQVLDLLVGEKLFEQAAEEVRLQVTEADVASRIEQLRQQEGGRLNLGRSLTDSEYQAIVSRTGLSWEEYREQLRKALIQQRYVVRTRGEELRSVTLPTEDDVVEFYKANKTTVFVQPDMVQFRHIFFDTRRLSDAEDRFSAREQAENIVRKIQNGAQFSDMVLEYSEDKDSQNSGGSFGGYFRSDDQGTREVFGQEFFEAPFRMEEGDISGVLRSNVGFHIIQITDKVMAKVLQLDDPVNPSSKNRVRDQIRLLLSNNVQTEAYQKALLSTLEELRDRAEIRIFDANLNW